MKVHVVESGDYEQRGIWCVAESPEAAVAHIKGTYNEPPYIVEWSWDEKEQCLTGVFQMVPGYSTAHTAYYDITEYELVSQP